MNSFISMLNFQKEKSDFLSKNDKSKKGSIDNDIKETVDLINSKDDYYTTSSCAGRIVLLEMKSRRKDECNWLLSKHSKVTFNEIKKILKECNIKNNPIKKDKNKKMNYQIWFKQQPLILHVSCRHLDAAKKLLDLSRKVFKHSGILSISENKAVVEIIGNEKIETVIADKNFIAEENYIKQLVKYANSNFEENKRKSDRFLEIVNKI